MAAIIGIWSKYYYVYLEGLLGTIVLSLVTIVLASILASFVALMKMSKSKIPKGIADFYLWLIRGTPVLLQLYFFWLLLPQVLPFEIPDSWAIVIALVVNQASYISEIIRSGIESVDKGQMEAAKSLGLKTRNIYRKIIIPQAMRNILPALAGQYITTTKQTSLASVFFITEITTAYKAVQSASFKAIEALVIAGLIYLALTGLLSRLFNLLEKRMKAYG